MLFEIQFVYILFIECYVPKYFFLYLNGIKNIFVKQL